MERKQLESAAASNHYLRGLLAIPFGIVWVAAGLGNMDGARSGTCGSSRSPSSWLVAPTSCSAAITTIGTAG